MQLGCLITTILGAASCVLARPAQQVPLTHHDDNTAVSAKLFMELEELARIVDIAYCVGMTGLGIYKPFQCASRCSEFEGFELVKAWNTGPLLSDSCGYIVLSHPPFPKRIIVAFRGTYSVANTIADLSTVPQQYVPYPGDGNDNETQQQTFATEYRFAEGKPPAKPPKCENCTVHMGFYRSWLNTRDEILPDLTAALQAYPDYKLTLVGHSLGAAVATLGALDLKARGWDPVTTTFGGPRIGNEPLVRYIDSIFDLPSGNMSDINTDAKMRRVTHADDPVPLLPLEEWGYRMHGGEIFISKPDLPPELPDLKHCHGDQDHQCIAGSDDLSQEMVGTELARISNLMETGKVTPDSLADVATLGWLPIPSRYKFWQLLFAHRDYFWRIGLCVPGGDPKDWYRKYPHYDNNDSSE